MAAVKDDVDDRFSDIDLDNLLSRVQRRPLTFNRKTNLLKGMWFLFFCFFLFCYILECTFLICVAILADLKLSLSPYPSLAPITLNENMLEMNEPQRQKING